MNSVNKTLLTVIIPIYNVENYLTRCLDSLDINLNNQVQYILVNDGSTDRSGLICQKWTNIYNNVLFIDKENGGLSSARNAGLKNVQSRWVYFVDSDDFVTNGFISNLLNMLKKLGDDELLTLPVMKNMDGSIKIVQDGSGYVGIDDFICDLINGKRQFGVWSYVFNTALLNNKNIIFENGKLFEDQYFVPNYLKFISKIQKISSNNLGFYEYCVRKNSISHSTINRQTIFDKLNAELYRDNFLEQLATESKTKQRIRQNKITVLFRAYIDYLKISDYKDASECKSQVINLLQYGQLGSLTLKHLVKIILMFLPNKLLIELS